MRELPFGDSEEMGPCPSCGGILAMTVVGDPDADNRPTPTLVHPMPFCHYFGVTKPAQIMIDMKTGRAVRSPE